jgi:hypothetical protein
MAIKWILARRLPRLLSPPGRSKVSHISGKGVSISSSLIASGLSNMMDNRLALLVQIPPNLAKWSRTVH